MILYVDGDSYTTPWYYVEAQDSYWSLFGDHVNASSVVNYAYIGKSNEGIMRNATRFAIENKNTEVFFLLGFTHLERRDFFASEFRTGNAPDKKNPNPKERGVRSKKHSGIDSPKENIITYSREFEEAQFLSNLLNLYGFFKYANCKFMFHFCSKPLEHNPLPLVNDFYLEVSNHKEIVNLFDNTYGTYNQKLNIRPADYSQYGWDGHHGPEGNKAYSEFLIKKYKEIYEN